MFKQTNKFKNAWSKSFSPNLFTHRTAGAKFFAVIFIVMLLAAGCKTDNSENTDLIPENGFIPSGEWSDGWGGSYTITDTTLEHDDGFGFTKFEGTIEAAVDFSQDSGAVIIKIIVCTTGITAGNYICVYYKSYTPTHVFLANAVDEFYEIIEVDSFIEAVNLFTVDNVDTHVTFWGTGYTR